MIWTDWKHCHVPLNLHWINLYNSEHDYLKLFTTSVHKSKGIWVEDSQPSSVSAHTEVIIVSAGDLQSEHSPVMQSGANAHRATGSEQDRTNSSTKTGLFTQMELGCWSSSTPRHSTKPTFWPSGWVLNRDVPRRFSGSKQSQTLIQILYLLKCQLNVFNT